MKKKCLYVAGGLALLLASAMTFKAVTGECPLMCLHRHLHGDSHAAATSTQPSN